MSYFCYLKYSHNALYIMKSVRFLAEYMQVFSTLSLERTLGFRQNFSPSKIIVAIALTEGEGAEAPFPSCAAVSETTALA